MVEFFGVARRRAGVERLAVEASTLGEVFDCLAEQLPDWARDGLEDGHLVPHYLANRNGEEFISDRRVPLSPGESLLILSADVGG